MARVFNRGTRRFATSVAFVLGTLCLGVGAARAQGVYFSNESVLKAFFPSSTHVTYVTLETTKHGDELKRLLGYLPPKKTYPVFVARTGEVVDGYAVIDEQLGQHLPITLATKVAPDGRIERTEIMVYRERYGGEVAAVRFRDQFVGKTVQDDIRSGDDIVAISGATISSVAVSVAVKRAAALVGIVTHAAKAAPGGGG
ncbi:MAG: FMN-binding protein [Myxococcota bacterium]